MTMAEAIRRLRIDLLVANSGDEEVTKSEVMFRLGVSSSAYYNAVRHPVGVKVGPKPKPGSKRCPHCGQTLRKLPGSHEVEVTIDGVAHAETR